MRAYLSLRRRSDFARVRRRGRRLDAVHAALVALAASGPTRVGIVTTKALGGAVVRNRARRRIRAALDRLALDRRPSVELIVTPRPSAGLVPFADLVSDLAASLGRLDPTRRSPPG